MGCPIESYSYWALVMKITLKFLLGLRAYISVCAMSNVICKRDALVVN